MAQDITCTHIPHLGCLTCMMTIHRRLPQLLLKKTLQLPRAKNRTPWRCPRPLVEQHGGWNWPTRPHSLWDFLNITMENHHFSGFLWVEWPLAMLVCQRLTQNRWEHAETPQTTEASWRFTAVDGNQTRGKFTIYRWFSTFKSSISFGDFPQSHLWGPESQRVHIYFLGQQMGVSENVV